MTTLEILGAVSPVPPQATQAIVKSDSQQLAVWTKKSILPGLAVGAVGSFLWKKHPVLGFLGGMVLGGNASSLMQGGGERRNAALTLGAAGVAIYASLKYRKHPALAYVGAGTAASLLSLPLRSKLA
jgi:hypothetical protein